MVYTDEIHDVAYGLLCDYMTSNPKTSGYTKEAFCAQSEWFSYYYIKALKIIRQNKINKLFIKK